MSRDQQNKLVAIVGPTASGKTALGLAVARRFNGEIVSADSRQVFRGMDIGSGKDLDDYQDTPYHLIDIREPNDEFSLADYQGLAYAAIDDIFERSRLPVVVGGSGLYLQAVIDGYVLPAASTDIVWRESVESLSLESLQAKLATANPDFYAKLNQSDRANRRRLSRYLELTAAGVRPDENKHQPRYQALLIGLRPELSVLTAKIKHRLLDRLDSQNMVGEVESLNAAGVTWSRLEKFGLEYKWLARYLQGKVEYEPMIELLYRDICRFAKRQLSWFKRWEKQGAQIHWVKQATEALTLVERFLQ